MACPTLIAEGFTLGQGTDDEDSGYGTRGIALSHGGTRLYVHDETEGWQPSRDFRFDDPAVT